MKKQTTKIISVLDSLCENHMTVQVYMGRFRMRGSISKSKGKYHIGTSSSLFQVVPTEVKHIKNLQGEKIG